ncbi:hypothetical protein ILP92_02865 [Maribius pontilimi]|uniref:Uncharacterized protein n=1 Tax=Palleronia pontilimi TaxID=1964209 RepID=A0A934I7J5_9RHOB|nr:hypothetical protein [Palleronia pontilimi]MBJ3761693.1 hypothetical protein [Palleronia pontilimi]
MAFLRPQAVAAILRWREAIIGLGAAALGAWWVFTEFGILRWVGVAFVLGGIAIAREGWSRARRPTGGGGPGVVEVDERQITYLSGHGGGAVSVEGLVRVRIVASRDGPYQSDVFWVFTAEDGTALHIPGDATGSEKIFDALAPLPGVDYETAIRASGLVQLGDFVIWEKPGHGKPRIAH